MHCISNGQTAGRARGDRGKEEENSAEAATQKRRKQEQEKTHVPKVSKLVKKKETNTEKKQGTREKYNKHFVSAQTVICAAETAQRPFLPPR